TQTGGEIWLSPTQTGGEIWLSPNCALPGNSIVASDENKRRYTLVRAGVPILQQYEALQPTQRVKTRSSLEDWDAYWNSDESTIQQADFAFVTDDLWKRIESGDEAFGPREFQRMPDALRRHFGAELGTVGPGSAYEQWKRSPQYQTWLKHPLFQ
ncbi:MAG: hypothetical protein KDB14_12315, partial [Planctomycetales bacterium]|nr:hypothetical protein [Planctomycetales bacterium]